MALLCAGFGIGLCTSLFSVLFALLLRPFPVADPQGIIGVVAVDPAQNIERGPLSFLDYNELRRENTAFSDLAGFSVTSLAISGRGEARQVAGALVSHNLFPLLGVAPIIGRPFVAADDRPGATPVVVLSHSLWSRDFGSDPAVTETSVRIDGVPHRIVGVMPPRFQFPERQEAWVPMAPRLAGHPRTQPEVEVLARLEAGTALERADAELASSADRLVREDPSTDSQETWRPIPLRDLYVSTGMRIMSITMMGAAICVLLIACANIANLLLSRAIRRRPEIALRTVLGASPRRITRQLLTESMVLAAGGGLLGLAFAAVSLRGLSALLAGSGNVPYWIVLSLEPPVIVFAIGAAVVTGLACGMVPALHAARVDFGEALQGRGAAGGRRSRRLRSSLVVAELAVSAILLIGGALFVRSFLALQEVDPGFEVEGLLTLRAHLPGERYEVPEARLGWARQALAELSETPGVEAAYVSSLIPLAGGMHLAALEVAGSDAGERPPQTYWAPITSDFFRTLGVGLRGRTFHPQEVWEGRPVAIVNRRFAERFFADRDPLGQSFRLLDGIETEWLTVVGVADGWQAVRLDAPEYPVVYLPAAFSPERETGLVVRAGRQPLEVATALRRELRSVDPDVPLFDVQTMSEVRRTATWQYRVVSQMFAIFGILALLLATVGLYGVISQSVGQRWREIGTRIALGAGRRQVIGLVVRQGMKLAAAGLVFGLIGAFLLAQAQASFLYGIGTVDLVSYSGLSVLLLLIAALASFLPALRATTVDPTQALRAE